MAERRVHNGRLYTLAQVETKEMGGYSVPILVLTYVCMTPEAAPASFWRRLLWELCGFTRC
jgi:hypothetical protein